MNIDYFITKLLISVIIFSTVSFQSTHANNIYADCYGRYIEVLLNNRSGVSGVVSIAKSGRPVVQKAVGLRDFVKRKPMVEDAIFELASLSKSFAATAAILLEKNGLLDYSDEIRKYIKEFPYKGITIAHLLSHSSGLPEYGELLKKHWDLSKVATNDDIIQIMMEHPEKLKFDPGTSYAYSNSGYIVLAKIVEIASGQTFPNALATTIFNPVGLVDTGIRSPKAWEADNFAKRFGFTMDESAAAYQGWLSGRYGPGRVSSSAVDLQKYYSMLFSGRVAHLRMGISIRRYILESIDKLVKEKTDIIYEDPLFGAAGYAFGWRIARHRLYGNIAFHEGVNPGYSHGVVHFFDDNMTAILLMNNGHSKFDMLFRGLVSVAHLCGSSR